MPDKEKRPAGNYAFFSHRDCEYFPCHPGADPENFNCLFCYCPLYLLQDKCGGAFRYLPSGVKDCTGCLVPHRRENYSRILEKLRETIQAQAADHRETDPLEDA